MKKLPPGYGFKGGKLHKLPPATKDGKRYLSAAEVLAVQLMNARTIIGQKNGALIALQTEIIRLQKELGETRTLVLQYQMQAETAENEKLAAQYNLPQTFDFQRDEAGKHYITGPGQADKPKVPVPAAGPPAAPTNGADDEANEHELAAMIAEAEADAIDATDSPE
jgi:hypothetical protein